VCAVCMCVCLLRVGQLGAGLGEWVYSRWLCGECVCLCVSVCECLCLCVRVCALPVVCIWVCAYVCCARACLLRVGQFGAV